MSWWWPFAKRGEAVQAESEFKQMLGQALLAQDDLEKATENLRASRKHRTRVVVNDPSIDPSVRTKARNG